MEGMLFLLVVTLPATFGQLTLMPSSNDDCRTECHDDRARVVCGTDNRTYRSICELRKAKCEGVHHVDLKHLGKCTEPVRCRAERAQAQAQAISVDVYIPECLDDGNYAEVQCQPSIGYCWCVEPSGRPIPGSSLQYEKPVCSQQGCRNAERTKFNENLIEIFRAEYHTRASLSSTHTDTHTHTRVDSSGNSEVKRVVQWKFDQLDLNKDNSLKRKEVRDLSRMTKRIVAPRECAKTFINHCDLDHDNRISRNEWSLCLGLDINKGVTSIRDLHGMRLKHYDDDEESEHVKNSDDSDSYNRAENQDCASARASALDNHRQDPEGGHYIPECTPDGFYQKSQCHKKINVCWCVNPRTGKPIRGTGARGSLPDCENVLRSAKMFKGCSLQRKHLFLEELLKHLSEQANTPKNSSDRGSYAVFSNDEIVRWKFNALDVNNNQFLDKKEWLAFRNEWKSFLKSKKQRKKARKLRKCWRNFPRLCDGNSNNKITIEEWISCTNSGRNYMQNFAPQKRRGPNPFSTILKSE